LITEEKYIKNINVGNCNSRSLALRNFKWEVAFRNETINGLKVVAIDGVELFESAKKRKVIII